MIRAFFTATNRGEREDAETSSKQCALLRDSATPRPVAVNAASNPVVALRRFRTPIPVRVHVEDGRPVRVWIDRSPAGYGGHVGAVWAAGSTWLLARGARQAPGGMQDDGIGMSGTWRSPTA